MEAYHRAIDRFLKTRAGGWAALHVMNPLDERLMRWSKGRLSTAVGTNFTNNAVLLRCTGAKTGKQRDIPLGAAEFDGGWVLVASRAGADKNPAWYHNLKAHPRCTLLTANRGEVPCIAHEAEGAERDRAWLAANAYYSGFTVYQGRTERRIPVMILVPEATA